MVRLLVKKSVLLQKQFIRQTGSALAHNNLGGINEAIRTSLAEEEILRSWAEVAPEDNGNPLFDDTPIIRLIIQFKNVQYSADERNILRMKLNNTYKGRVIFPDNFIETASTLLWKERGNDKFISNDKLIYDIGSFGDLPQAMDLNNWNNGGSIIMNPAEYKILITYEENIRNKFNNPPGSGFIFTPQQINYKPYNFNSTNMLPNKYYLYLCLEY